MEGPDGYGNPEIERQFASYASLVAVYSALLAVGILRARKAPSSLVDLALLGVATHKLSRIITKDAVTSPFRAPFTRYLDSLGYGEIQEESRDTGLKASLGDVLSCNYCADPWIALFFLYGLDLAPETTRSLLRFFSAIALADHLHVIYEGTRSRINVLTLREHALESAQPAP